MKILCKQCGRKIEKLYFLRKFSCEHCGAIHILKRGYKLAIISSFCLFMTTVFISAYFFKIGFSEDLSSLIILSVGLTIGIFSGISIITLYHKIFGIHRLRDLS